MQVSKQNYCFSDFPFPPETCEFPHWSEMAKYVNAYVKHFKVRRELRFGLKRSDDCDHSQKRADERPQVDEHIVFNTTVERLVRDSNEWVATTKSSSSGARR